MKILAAILAGGRSRRFGSDKAMATIGGVPLIEHVARAVRSLVDPHIAEIIVVGRDHGPAGMAALADWPAPDLGPVGGIATGLNHARQYGYDAVFTLACDMPLLPADVLQRLYTAGPPAFYPAVPLIGLWPVTLAELAGQHVLGSANRSVRHFAEYVGAAAVAGMDDLPNVNAPADLTILTEIMASRRE